MDNRPGSVNRGFASLDPERQREAVADGGTAAGDSGKPPPGARRVPPAGAPAQPKVGRRGRVEPTPGEEDGSA